MHIPDLRGRQSFCRSDSLPLSRHSPSALGFERAGAAARSSLWELLHSFSHLPAAPIGAEKREAKAQLLLSARWSPPSSLRFLCFSFTVCSSPRESPGLFARKGEKYGGTGCLCVCMCDRGRPRPGQGRLLTAHTGAEEGQPWAEAPTFPLSLPEMLGVMMFWVGEEEEESKTVAGKFQT